MEGAMELRHLRYFVAVAEAGSLTVAAEKTLHTAQPSLSRQMRDLEYEAGTTLMTRGGRGGQTRRAVRQTHVRAWLPDRSGDGLATRSDAHSSGRAAQHRGDTHEP